MTEGLTHAEPGLGAFLAKLSKSMLVAVVAKNDYFHAKIPFSPEGGE